jgi:uncharacterized membrane protein
MQVHYPVPLALNRIIFFRKKRSSNPWPPTSTFMPTRTKSPPLKPAIRSGTAKKIVKACTINKSPEELFRFWRPLENLPRFARHLISVTRTSDRESHWIAKSPATTTVEWDAIIINERENSLIAWESKEGSEIKNAGSVHFQPAPDDQGTEVRVTLEYVPPLGKLGAALAKLYGEEPDLQVEDDLLRFKALMETGEIPTTEGQPVGAGRKSRKEKRGNK